MSCSLYWSNLASVKSKINPLGWSKIQVNLHLTSPLSGKLSRLFNQSEGAVRLAASAPLLSECLTSEDAISLLYLSVYFIYQSIYPQIQDLVVQIRPPVRSQPPVYKAVPTPPTAGLSYSLSSGGSARVLFCRIWS